MQFCPHDGTLLLVNVLHPDTPAQELRFICPVCPYIHVPRKKMTTVVPTTRKRVDDDVHQADAWENVERTKAQCEVCGNMEAGFRQFQIRSADEPMTIFYKCMNKACGHRWSE